MVVGSSVAVGGLLVACGSAKTGSGFSNHEGGTEPASDAGIAITADGSSSGLKGGGDGGTGNPGKTLFYVHTNTTLYSVDPSNVSAAPVQIGDFDCIGGSGDTAMTDLGVAKDGSLYGVSQKAAYPLTIVGMTVHCADRWPLPSKNNNFYGLTVAPENTVAAVETLIAADSSGSLWQVDVKTGATTQVGTLGTDPSSSKAWMLSGDIVFLANGGSPVGFATVRTSSSGGDTLVELDVAKVKPGTASALQAVIGPITQQASCAAPSVGVAPAVGTAFHSMYGIAAYESKVYGFSHTGQIVEIDNNTGGACLLSALPSTDFSGAGVTTSAPIVPPTPR